MTTIEVTKNAVIYVVLLSAVAGCSKSSGVVLRPGNFKSPTPDNGVQPLGFKVADYPTFEELAREFKKAHQESEKIYNGGGSWGKGYGTFCDPPSYHPLIRDTGRRVIGYIDAYRITGEAIYKQRAREGLAYLLAEQQDTGGFLWWWGDPATVKVGGLYTNSVPAVALLEGYKLFKDARYLAAAKRVCDYICAYGHADKANYNLFASWSLATYYEVTGEKSYLEMAAGFALHAIGRDGFGYQLPSGGWSNKHDQYAWYHGIILRGLAKLLSVMPENDPHRTEIQNATIKALNHLISRHHPDGRILVNATDGNATWDPFTSHGIAIVATQLNWPVVDSVRLTAKGLLKYRKTQQRRGACIMAIVSLMRAYRQADHLK